MFHPIALRLITNKDSNNDDIEYRLYLTDRIFGT